MRILIDTHTLIWFIGDPLRLSDSARLHIIDDFSDVLISIASLWEISIKSSKGRLMVAGGYEFLDRVLVENELGILDVKFAHTVKQNPLPFHHRDPFDRMIVAQAIVDGIDLISRDDIFDEYFTGTEVKRIW